MNAPFSDELVAFIQEVVDSVELVEVLLLLAAAPQTTFTVEDVARRLATSMDSVRLRLEYLSRIALVHASEGRHRFAPATAKRARLVADLGVAYRSHRVRVIDIIFGASEPPAGAQKSN